MNMEERRKKQEKICIILVILILILALMIMIINNMVLDVTVIIKLGAYIVVFAIGIFIASNQYKERMNKYYKPLMNYEGDNKSFADIEKLLGIVDEYNRTRPGAGRHQWLPIKLVGISSKEQLNINKKYSVKIFSLGLGDETEIIIKEQNNE